jgi:hypothetical protein
MTEKLRHLVRQPPYGGIRVVRTLCVRLPYY